MPGSAQQAETSSADVLSHCSQGQVRWACKSILAQHTKQFSFFVQFKRLKKKKKKIAVMQATSSDLKASKYIYDTSATPLKSVNSLLNH